jgi:hypothetical protein
MASVALVGGLAVQACSSSSTGAHDWTADSEPSAGARVEANACAALAACCDAGQSGDLYCEEASASGCPIDFQYELNYGYCAGFTYTGFVAAAYYPICSCPGDLTNVPDSGEDDAGDAAPDARGDGAREDAH